MGYIRVMNTQHGKRNQAVGLKASVRVMGCILIITIQDSENSVEAQSWHPSHPEARTWGSCLVLCIRRIACERHR